MGILFTWRWYIRYLYLCNRYSAQRTTRDESIRYAQVKARFRRRRCFRRRGGVRIVRAPRYGSASKPGINVVAFFSVWKILKSFWDDALCARRSGSLRLSVTDTVSQPARRASTARLVSSRDHTAEPKSVRKSMLHLDSMWDHRPWTSLSIHPRTWFTKSESRPIDKTPLSKFPA